MKRNKDDRRDNVDKIQSNINHTIENYAKAEEMISETDDPKTKDILADKNKRRKDALNGMRSEITDEAMDKKNNYK